MKIEIAGTGYVGLSKLHALGWKHTVELKDGIKTMYEWYLKENSK